MKDDFEINPGIIDLLLYTLFGDGDIISIFRKYRRVSYCQLI